MSIQVTILKTFWDAKCVPTRLEGCAAVASSGVSTAGVRGDGVGAGNINNMWGVCKCMCVWVCACVCVCECVLYVHIKPAFTCGSGSFRFRRFCLLISSRERLSILLCFGRPVCPEGDVLGRWVQESIHVKHDLGQNCQSAFKPSSPIKASNTEITQSIYI